MEVSLFFCGITSTHTATVPVAVNLRYVRLCSMRMHPCSTCNVCLSYYDKLANKSADCAVQKNCHPNLIAGLSHGCLPSMRCAYPVLSGDNLKLRENATQDIV